MMQKYRRKKQLLQPIQDKLDPPTISILCSGSIKIDNCKGISRYTENGLEIDMGKLRVQIKGENLLLQHLTKGAMGVQGKLESLIFIYGE